ncbi:Tll0287-like domain-containing protein [Flavihumibacter fluvii]|uniref:Tll0287-like domain-containing protein n=1 Tax=Flavihumibacter fluvii TaxID=2838157 RepID=UPI001BDEAC27|nr:DUF3365 domain-containing protein [Flavihumibacter fluvii]ULQ54229.1 DUF3365 domain-containing protein [Flavihumibacter fluvii]
MKVLYLITLVVLVFLSGCRSNNHPEEVPADYKKMGDSIAAASFNHIKSALQNAMATNGPEQAVLFCRAQAIKLTGTLSSDSVQVYRVAERYRNPTNKLREDDQSIWKNYQQAMAKGDSVFSMVIEKEAVVDYYKPILLQPMCLTCHGEPQKNIPNALLHTIDSVYPGDLAKGFSPGDLRGMWHIQFKKRH